MKSLFRFFLIFQIFQFSLISGGACYAAEFCLDLLLAGRSDAEKRYMRDFRRLVEWSGGVVTDGVFVEKPGVRLLAVTRWNHTVPAALEWEATSVTFLVAGSSIETTIELLSHGPEVARLTTSKTSAMDFPMFRIQGDEASRELQKKYLLKTLAFSRELDGKGEFFNRLHSGAKSTVLTVTMKLASLHHVFFGRLPKDGNEEEVREIFREMSRILKEKYPQWILPVETYEHLGPRGRLAPAPATLQKEQGLSTVGTSSPVPVLSNEIEILGQTEVSEGASKLFTDLRVDSHLPLSDQLSEFRARLTYLAFPEAANTTDAEKGVRFLRKMVHENSHLSVIAAHAVTVQVSNATPQLETELSAYGVSAQRTGDRLVFSLDLRQAYRFFSKVFHRSTSPSKAMVAFSEALCMKMQGLFPSAIVSPGEFRGSEGGI